MPQGRTLIFVIVALIVGFGGGFILRPVISPNVRTVEIARSAPVVASAAQARGTQYFVAHVEEARQVVAGCRDGSVRGGECANAEEAIIKVDAAERRKRFLGN